MSFRVVLYAEGAAETAGSVTQLPEPLHPLAEDMLGPAHMLVRRCLSPAVPESAITFLAPLRTSRGRVARGSDLLHVPTLRRLLAFPRRPDLAVVLVDGDEDRSRKATLEAALEGLAMPRVIGVAPPEFEAWLIADHEAVGAVLGRPVPTPPDPESMRRRQAKALLQDWLTDGPAEARISVASRCDLDRIGQRCPAFATFRADLAARSP